MSSPAWLRIRAVMRRHAYVQKRAPHRWFDVMVWPIVDTVIWGSIGRFVDQQGGAVRSGALSFSISLMECASVAAVIDGCFVASVKPTSCITMKLAA